MSQGYTYKPGLYMINQSLGRVGYRSEYRVSWFTFQLNRLIWWLEQRQYEIQVINTTKILYELEPIRVYQEK